MPLFVVMMKKTAGVNTITESNVTWAPLFTSAHSPPPGVVGFCALFIIRRQTNYFYKKATGNLRGKIREYWPDNVSEGGREGGSTVPNGGFQNCITEAKWRRYKILTAYRLCGLVIQRSRVRFPALTNFSE
jgi:hypothetical protein